MSGMYDAFIWEKFGDWHKGFGFLLEATFGFHGVKDKKACIGVVPQYEENHPDYRMHKTESLNIMLHMYKNKLDGVYLPLEIDKSADYICDSKTKEIFLFFPNFLPDFQERYPFEKKLLEKLYGKNKSQIIYDKFVYGIRKLRQDLGKQKNDFFASVRFQAPNGQKGVGIVGDDSLVCMNKDLLEAFEILQSDDMPLSTYIDGNMNLEQDFAPMKPAIGAKIIFTDSYYCLIKRHKINGNVVEEWYPPSSSDIDKVNRLLMKKKLVKVNPSHSHTLKFYKYAIGKKYEPLNVGLAAPSYENNEEFETSDILHLTVTDGKKTETLPCFIMEEASIN